MGALPPNPQDIYKSQGKAGKHREKSLSPSLAVNISYC